MSKVMNLGNAIALASKVFEDKVDRGGQPYILHCLQVMDWVDNDPELKIIAVLHDVIEDSDYSLEDLKRMGYSRRVTMALDLLTNDAGLTYEEYIECIPGNLDAIRVKIADLRHNSDPTRLKKLNSKDFERMSKYHKSIKFLEEELKKW